MTDWLVDKRIECAKWVVFYNWRKFIKHLAVHGMVKLSTHKFWLQNERSQFHEASNTPTNCTTHCEMATLSLSIKMGVNEKKKTRETQKQKTRTYRENNILYPAQLKIARNIIQFSELGEVYSFHFH